MATFCDDTDLLHWEPNLFSDAAFASQTLLSATADLAGATLTFAAGALADTHVAPRHVAVLSGGVTGAFVVTAVSTAALTVSPLHDGLFPAGEPAVPGRVGTATGLAVVVRTFRPQAAVVTALLRQAAGAPDGGRATIVNAGAFRRACTLGTLHMVLGTLAAAAEDVGPLHARAQFYETSFRRSLRCICAEIDTNGDGAADVARPLNVLELQRI